MNAVEGFSSVVGIDPSLTATGIATVAAVTTINTGRKRGMERLAYIENVVFASVLPGELVVIEGYSHGSQHNSHAMGELGGVIRLDLWKRGVRYIDVAPLRLKKYATGKGLADKTAVVVAARDRLGYDGTNDNEADALWLRAIGMDLIGDPLCDLPQVNRSAIAELRELI